MTNNLIIPVKVIKRQKGKERQKAEGTKAEGTKAEGLVLRSRRRSRKKGRAKKMNIEHRTSNIEF